MIETNEQLFLRVVDAGSLKAAAEQVHADPSAVSRKIAALEDRLGVKLLQRSTKRSTPTEAGARYYEGMRALISQQSALEAQVAGLVDTPIGILRVAAPVDFGAEFVAPVLSTLQEQAPSLKVELLLGSTFSDLVEQNIDVAIRIGRLPDSSLIARRLGAVPRVIVASKEYVQKQGLPETPDQTELHPFIIYRPEQNNSVVKLRRAGKQVSMQMSGSLTVNSVSAIRKLVCAGKGLHLGPTWVFKDGLTDGSLVQVLPEFELDTFPLHALYVPTSYVPAKVRAFIDLMIQSVRSNAAISE
ncbi:LysR family transcriptional regulator [uncultured Tateyamaria sp.]|uniref:LysR family transcriptional regulator n=1 Tax=uncultured Tateyamaria sp. TaxID=455651 RepID=UPI0026304598|nr:LysR family transcriptional regulator [uncultured Tateyamaria sp.]